MWKLIETVEQEVKVELEGGHTAVLRPLTPMELRKADSQVPPLSPFHSRVVSRLFQQAEQESNTPEADRVAYELTPVDTEALAALDSWRAERALARLTLAIVKLDGVDVTDFKALLNRIRPVEAALSLILELGAKLDDILSLPEEGKD